MVSQNHQNSGSLRRRLQILERAQSLSSSISGLTSASATTAEAHANRACSSTVDRSQNMDANSRGRDGEDHSSLTDYETDYESETTHTDEDQSREGQRPQDSRRHTTNDRTRPEHTAHERSGVPHEHHSTTPRPGDQFPRPDTTSQNVELRSRNPSNSLMSPTSKAWYEYDLAVVVALVSPVGNWLTGGDYIKNLLLFILLIFYLHQIIEMPWHLYNRCRPRHPPLNIPRPSQLEPDSRFRSVAQRELRMLELFFLSLSIISPFLGALLLRIVSASVAGPDALSWFSMSLFVLATGIRPWQHLIQRLGNRAEDLHDTIHQSRRLEGEMTLEEKVERRKEEMDTMIKKMDAMGQSLARLRARVRESRDEVFEYVDEALEALEKLVRKDERRVEGVEGRVKAIEEVVKMRIGKDLKGKGRAKGSWLGIETDLIQPPPRTNSTVVYLLSYVLPAWLLPALERHPSSPGHYQLHNQYHNGYVHGSSPTRHSIRSFSSSYASPYAASTSSMRLETIPEEDGNNRSTTVQHFAPARSAGYSTASSPSRTTTMIATSPILAPASLMFRLGYIATFPLRMMLSLILRR